MATVEGKDSVYSLINLSLHVMENYDDEDDKSSSGGGGGSGGNVKRILALGRRKICLLYKYALLLMTAVSLILFNAGLSNTWPQDTVMMFLKVLIFITLYCR